MESINFNFLENLPQDDIKAQINYIFADLVDKLREFLNLEIINSQFKIRYNDEKNESKQNIEDILDLGVIRKVQNNILFIEVFAEYQHFLPLILVREALMCWVPNNLKNNKGVKVIINQIVELFLSNFDILNEWKAIFNRELVDYDFLMAEFDKLEKFLRCLSTS